MIVILHIRSKINKAFIFIIFLGMLLIVCAGLFFQEKECINTIKFVVSTDSTTEKISIMHNNGKYYAFLPSYTDFESMGMEFSGFCSIYLDDLKCNSKTSFADLSANSEYKLVVKNIVGMTVSQETLVIMKSENIPSMSLKLVNGTLDDVNRGKTTERTGTCTIIKQDKTIDYSGVFDNIHGRGNTSWKQKKKPYALEFSDETNLLSMGSNTDWILIANAMDESNIRNKIVYDAAIKSGLDYSVDTNFVDLYVDDEYYGLYLLSEKVEVSKNRIDIADLSERTQNENKYKLSNYETISKQSNGVKEKTFAIPNNPLDITGGYLVELELPTRVDGANNLFTTKGGQSVAVKCPSYTSEKEMDYISSLFQKIEDSLTTDEVFNYIDINSWVNYYLVQETFVNISRTSFFFYKDSDTVDSKVYAGPIWDFDLSLGTNFEDKNSHPNQFYINQWGWFEKLYTNPTFRNAVESRYKNGFKDLISQIVNEKIDEYSNRINKSYLMNEVRWAGIQFNWWVNHYDAQQQHSEYLKNFLNDRIDFLDKVWLEHSTIGNNIETSVDNAEDIPEPSEPTVENTTQNISIVQNIKSNLFDQNNYLVIAFFAFICCVVVFGLVKGLVGNKKVRCKHGKKR